MSLTLPNQDRSLSIGLGLSILFHLALLPFLLFLTSDLSVPASVITDVTFIPAPSIVAPLAPQKEGTRSTIKEHPIQENLPNQIVSPPDASQESSSEKKETRLLSDRDFFTTHEQIKRGDNGGVPGKPLKEEPVKSAAPSQPEKAPVVQPKVPKQPSKAVEPVINGEMGAPKQLALKLDDNTLLSKFNTQESSSSAKASVGGAEQPFSRPVGSGAQFLGREGSADYLPNLPDGDMTLLNAKANKFAVFVRRVALQVFGQIRGSGFDGLSASDIQAVSSYAVVRGRLSLQGALIDVAIEGSSGSPRFDQMLAAAVKRGLRDQNPPPDAVASDGTIHFVFKSNAWSRVESAPRTGAPFERRWLLLATGLD